MIKMIINCAVYSLISVKEQGYSVCVNLNAEKPVTK